MREDLAQREIYAPFDGYVTEEHVEVGEWAAAGAPIVEVVEIDEVYVEVAPRWRAVLGMVLQRLAPGRRTLDLMQNILESPVGSARISA